MHPLQNVRGCISLKNEVAVLDLKAAIALSDDLKPKLPIYNAKGVLSDNTETGARAGCEWRDAIRPSHAMSRARNLTMTKNHARALQRLTRKLV